jgi:hypothetical protein
MGTFFWIGWLISVATFLAGIWLTRRYKKVDQLNKAIDAYLELVIKIEDMALDYWVLDNQDVYEWQITLQLRRLSRLMNQISKIDRKIISPSSHYIAFKQSVSLISISRPIQHNSDYASKIMNFSVKLQDYYTKQ